MRVVLMLALALASFLLLTSCAPHPSDQGVLNGGVNGSSEGNAAHASPIPRISSVAIVVDTVIARDEIGSGGYYVLGASRDASSWMLSSASRAIERGPYHVDRTLAPFIGGFLSEDRVVDVATSIGDQARAQSPPFYVAPAVSSDADYSDALVAVLRRAASTNVMRRAASTNIQDMGPLVTYPHSLSSDRPDWELLYERMGTDYLLVVVSGAVSVAGAKQTGQFCLSSCLSMVWTAFLTAICSHVTGQEPEECEVEGEVSVETPSQLMSAAVLFDMRTGAKVWSGSAAFSDIDPMSSTFYSGKWAQRLLADIRFSP